MNIINAENLTKSYTERKLLDKASFYLQEGEKVGVIGINGTGKSTLLKIIAGLEEPDEGQGTCANHIVVRYLPQNPVFDPEMTVLDSVLTQCVLNFVGSGRTERTDADAHAQEQKWSLESDAKSMMTRLGITDFTQKTGELSGGQSLHDSQSETGLWLRPCAGGCGRPDRPHPAAHISPSWCVNAAKKFFI